MKKKETYLWILGIAALIGAVAAHMMKNDPLFLICAIVIIAVDALQIANMAAKK